MLELDHVFWMVADPGQPARRLEDDGWVLDAGQAHRGQGTRNRRLAWREQFFELLWVTDAAQARANPLRLDRRADWTSTGASPIGLAFRGEVEPAHRDEFWLYDALGPRIWIHGDNERFPERPRSSCSKPAKNRSSSAGDGSRRPRPWRIAVPVNSAKSASADRPRRPYPCARDHRSSTSKARTRWSW